MHETSIRNLSKYVVEFAHQKIPLMVHGTYGIGKSSIMLQSAEKICNQLNDKNNTKRKFVNWEDLFPEERKHCINNPEKYYVFYDIRLSICDPADLRGIPNISTTDPKYGMEVLPWSWVVYFTQKDSAGLIFFDEINLATTSMSAAAYKIINDRCVADMRLGDEVYCTAAGNTNKDKAYINEMPRPLKDRFAEVEVIKDVEYWLEHAAKSNYNGHLMAFIRWKEDNLHRVCKSGITKDSTPRGIERASRILNQYSLDDIDTTEENGKHIKAMLQMCVGETFTEEFFGYVSHYQDFNWNALFENPKEYFKKKKINDNVDKKFVVIGGIVEKMRHTLTEEMFNKCGKVIINLEPDFIFLAGTSIAQMIDNKDFEKWTESPEWKKIINCLAKYIAPDVRVY